MDQRVLTLLVLDAQDLAEAPHHDLVQLLAHQLSNNFPCQVHTKLQRPVVGLFSLPLNNIFALYFAKYIHLYKSI